MQPDATSELTPNQARAIRNLLTYPSIELAAEKTGVNRTTLWRWMTEDATFQAALSDAQARALDGVLRRLIYESRKAINTLADIHADKNAPASARVGAASKILSLLPEMAPPPPLPGQTEMMSAALVSGQWVAFRTMLLEALMPYPDARAALAEMLDSGDDD